MPSWTLPAALVFVRQLQPIARAVGYHLGMLGSVLLKGRSGKDLDVLVYPHSDDADGHKNVTRLFRDAGLRLVYNRATVRKRWKMLRSRDTKHVEVWEDHQGRRIDFFFLK